MRIAIFGAGKAGKYLYGQIEQHAKDIETECFIDNLLTGEQEGKAIYHPSEFFGEKPVKIDAVFLAAGAQKTLKLMTDICRKNGMDEIYMMHDIAGKSHLALFDGAGNLLPSRIRKLRFSDVKPSLHYFEVPVTDECNLNCRGCLFASNVCGGGTQHVEISQLEKDAERMSELFYDVPWIRILGGEPLLHPDIIKIFEVYRKYFPDSEVDLCTNGLLIPKMPEAFWECVERERISIHVSGYRPTYNLLDKIDVVLRQHNMPYAILRREEFKKYYTDKADNDMAESFQKCIASGCYEVYRGKLSTCSAAIAFGRFNELFHADYKITENEDWFDIHKPGIDAWKVKEKLEKPSYICKYCRCSEMESFAWDYSPRKVRFEDYLINTSCNKPEM